MRGIGSVAAENPSGSDDAHRQFVSFHNAHLHRAGLGTQDAAIGEIKGILGITGGVIVGGIQSIKVVINIFDFGAVNSYKSHTSENFNTFVGELGDGVTVAASAAASGQSKVESFGIFAGLFALAQCIIERILNSAASGIESASGLPAFFGGDRTHFFGQFGEQSIAPEVGDTDSFQLCAVCCRSDFCHRFISGAIHGFNDIVHKDLPEVLYC